MHYRGHKERIVRIMAWHFVHREGLSANDVEKILRDHIQPELLSGPSMAPAEAAYALARLEPAKAEWRTLLKKLAAKRNDSSQRDPSEEKLDELSSLRPRL